MSAVRRVLTVLILGIVLVACDDDPNAPADTGGEIPAVLAPQRAACERDGGRWGSVPGRDAFICYRVTRDANKPCESQRDCEGLCLARSRTCAPQTPFLGCHEVLGINGVRQTRCLE